uniref:FAS1 domain-containing protein n=1 Tax=Davidia involucrata TaxID=16924 RepID=A0A5B7BQL5_DAVIN
MNSKISIFFTFFLLFNCSINAFNITTLLGQYPDFKTFNDYLTQTQLAGQINSRQTITVLAIDNAGLSPLSGKSTDVLKKILSTHIVLDYYDVSKLQKLSNKTALLTTLFQSSGQATGQQGFLNVTDLSTGSVVFGSAAKGATLGANLVKSIAAQPFNISVLQISTVIIPVGIESSNSSSNSTKPPSASPAKSPSKPPAPSKAPKAPSNTTAPVPAGSPPKPAADAPTADASAAAAAAPGGNSPSAAAAFGLSLGVVVMIIVSSTLSLMLMV